MAAHDDKIASNRRRLFKALAATPVVMTLRPGAALANASAYQCLAKDTVVDSIAPADTASLCGPDEDCFAYLLLDYWAVPDTAPETPDATCIDLRAAVVVETRPGVFVTTTNDVVTARVVKNGDGTLNVMSAASAGVVCYSNVPKSQGYFLVLGETIDDPTTGAPVGYDLTNTLPFPERAHTADFQGITQTCLLSIDPNATTPFIFVKG